MIRRIAVLTVALAAPACVGACVGPRIIGATPETPLWLQDRIDAIEQSHRGYPSLEDVPPYSATGDSHQRWAEGVTEMEALRAEVMSDPALADPDALEAGERPDAAEIARRAREQAERDVERQTVEE